MRGVWPTPAAREEFRPSELEAAIDDYTERGPQYFAGEPRAGFALYSFSGGRVLVLAERRGLLSLMTKEELGEEQPNLRREGGGGW
jgi:hypothetical protein